MPDVLIPIDAVALLLASAWLVGSARCPSCEHHPRLRDRVSLVSFLWTRCRGCEQPYWLWEGIPSRTDDKR